MAIPVSGPVSILDLATEFGGTAPHSMSEYYRGGGLVPNNNTGVPTSGVISLSDFYGAVAALVLEITSNTSEYNILTAATAAGYNAASDTTPIIVNVASGVTVSGSSTHALRTGALNANSDLTINISGSVDGYTGANGGLVAGAGSVGGDALFFETLTGGSGTYIVNVFSGANLRGGGGGGGGGGQRGARYQLYDPKLGCYGGVVFGSYGSTGAAGGFGQAGSNGGPGSYGGGIAGCEYQSPGVGGSGGAAGFAARYNGRSVTLNNSGTVAGSTA